MCGMLAGKLPFTSTEIAVKEIGSGLNQAAFDAPLIVCPPRTNSRFALAVCFVRGRNQYDLH